jgi:hypothetical protein
VCAFAASSSLCAKGERIGWVMFAEYRTVSFMRSLIYILQRKVESVSIGCLVQALLPLSVHHTFVGERSRIQVSLSTCLGTHALLFSLFLATVGPMLQVRQDVSFHLEDTMLITLRTTTSSSQEFLDSSLGFACWTWVLLFMFQDS